MDTESDMSNALNIGADDGRKTANGKVMELASCYSSAEIFKLNADAMQYAKWNENEADVDFVQHAKNSVAHAIQNELTEKQKLYFLMYFVDKKNMDQIASELAVNKSTVSRMVTSAKKKLARVLVYTSPHLINAQVEKRNRRYKQ